MLLEVLAVVAAVPFLAVAALLMLLLSRSSWKKTFPVPDVSTDNVVIISGCDSGIGRVTALSLLDLGFHVVATTLTKNGPSDLIEDARGRPGELSVLHVDITDANSVQSLTDFVEDLLESNEAKNVFGLVNNAGICVSGPIEVVPYQGFEKQLQVNVFGHVRMSQKLLPFIRRDAKTSGGRVVNICSVLGRVTAASFLGGYCASKYAMEAVTDSMRRELFHTGVSVSAIEPGAMNTHFLHSIDIQKDWQGFHPEHRECYRPLMDDLEKNVPRLLANASDPSMVATAIVHALTASKPQTRYLVGPDANVMAFAAWILPDRLLDEFLAMM